MSARRRIRSCLVLLVIIAGCAGDDGLQGPMLEPLPEVVLEGAEERAREQILERRAALEEILRRDDATAAETATAFGDLGDLYLAYDLLEAAEVCFANARRLEPEGFRWLYLEAYVALGRGDLESAAAGFRRALEREGDYLPARLRLGRLYLQQGELEAAASAFEEVLRIDPSAAAAHEGLGRVAAARGEPALAVRHLERALELDPAANGVHYALGQAHRDLGDRERALHHLERGGDVQARIVDPLVNPLAELAASPAFYLAQAAEALDDEDYGAAAAAFRATLERDPQEMKAHRGLALSLEQLGDLEGAVAALDRALEALAKAEETAPSGRRALELAELHVQRGELAVELGRNEEALTHFAAALELVPESVPILLRTANACARQGRLEEAMRHFDRVLELEPELEPLVLEKRAVLLVNLGRGEEALEDLRRLRTLLPEDPRPGWRYADALRFLGRPQEADAARREADLLAEKSPLRPQLLLEAGRRLARQGSYGEAMAALEEALRLSPDLVEARFELGALLGGAGRYREAAAELERVLEVVPQHMAARRLQLVALIFDRRYGEARMKLSEGLRLFPRARDLALTQIRLLTSCPDPVVRDGALAFEVAQRVAAESDDVASREALAMALAAVGDTEEAADLQRSVLAGGGGSRGGDARLAAYEAGRAWTAGSAEELLVWLRPPAAR